MTVRVALLRGVNVGGAHKLPMAAFRAILADLGCGDAATYIQSGNAVFRSDRKSGALAAAIADAIAAGHGFRPKVFVLFASDLDSALAANPFAAEATADGASVHFHFLGAPLPDGFLASLAPYATRGERTAVAGNVLYLHAPQGIGRSALAEQLARTAKVPMTARNARSTAAIAALARALRTCGA